LTQFIKRECPQKSGYLIQLINAQGVSILLVEQSLHKALAIAHYGYVIQTGRIVMEGTGTALLNDPDIKKAYLGL
jgi:branched-chain amino acid transport system ATP-binding protein